MPQRCKETGKQGRGETPSVRPTWRFATSGLLDASCTIVRSFRRPRDLRGAHIHASTVSSDFVKLRLWTFLFGANGRTRGRAESLAGGVRAPRMAATARLPSSLRNVARPSSQCG